MNTPLPSRLSVSDYRARFSVDEFRDMSATGMFDGMKVELVRGELERMHPPQLPHSRVQTALLIALARLIGPADETLVLVEVGIRVGQDTVLGCDVAIARRNENERWLDGADVLLVVEVSSTTLDRDLGMKRREYARAGIPDYWVVDVERRVVHRFTQPDEGEYLALATLHFGEPVPVPGTDGTIRLD